MKRARGNSTEVASAIDADLAPIRALLEQAGLPNRDLENNPAARFWVVREGGRLIGAVGLETYGGSGLLRSLVVAPEARRSGLGGRLVDELEIAARRSGLDRLLLLTETAEGFFARRGYTVIDRANAPDEVRSSAEFRSLCPASATCMSKSWGEAS
jgi:amino-acid N-acetyltransferase